MYIACLVKYYLYTDIKLRYDTSIISTCPEIAESYHHPHLHSLPGFIDKYIAFHWFEYIHSEKTML